MFAACTAPTQPIPVVCFINGERKFALMRWGLLPSWVKDPKAFSLIINARGENVLDKPAFRAAMKRRRCLVPADGFYEWKAGGARKQPYFIHAKSGEPLALAGLWETWTGPHGEELDTVAIVTTDANRTLQPMHDRMPVIVAPEAFDLWLDGDRVDDKTAAALIAPAPDDLLEAYPVSTDVNRVANDDAHLIAAIDLTAEVAPPPPRRAAAAAKKPVKAKADDGQGRLF